ncbi:MAG: response regulator [Bdellovibrionota bacterium]
MIITKARILLVDDEPLVLEMIEGALKSEGYEVVCAPNSQAALKHLDRTDFDAMVCDVRLENLDGFDLLGLARKKHPSIAGLLMTGAPCPDDLNRAEQLSASYLSKPIGMVQLLATVEQLLDEGRSEEDRNENVLAA